MCLVAYTRYMSPRRICDPAGARARELVESLTMHNFKLRLALGNDAMSTPDDVADALRRAAIVLAARDSWADIIPGETFKIYDDNGNRVGSWEVC